MPRVDGTSISTILGGRLRRQEQRLSGSELLRRKPFSLLTASTDQDHAHIQSSSDNKVFDLVAANPGGRWELSLPLVTDFRGTVEKGEKLVLRVGDREVKVPRDGRRYGVSFDSGDQRIITLNLHALEHSDPMLDRGMVWIALPDLKDGSVATGSQAELHIGIKDVRGFTGRDVEAKYLQALENAGQILEGIVNK